MTTQQTTRILLNNQISEEEVKILVYSRSGSYNYSTYADIDRLIEKLKTGVVTNILLDTGAVIHYKDGSFSLSGYRQNYTDVIPLLEYLEIEPEFKEVELK